MMVDISALNEDERSELLRKRAELHAGWSKKFDKRMSEYDRRIAEREYQEEKRIAIARLPWYKRMLFRLGIICPLREYTIAYLKRVGVIRSYDMKPMLPELERTSTFLRFPPVPDVLKMDPSTDPAVMEEVRKLTKGS